ncbi:hypothetical protein PTKIN_Ptkin16aG0112400 [Pterospermum kingtungense]
MMQHCSHLEELSIGDCFNVRSLPNGKLPISLKQLNIERCGVQNYSEILLYTSLESLEIVGRCNPLETFPLESFPKLNNLSLWGCDDLKWIGALGSPHQQHLAFLNNLSIWFCPNLISFREGLSATNLTSLVLFFCENLKSLPEHMHSIFPSLGVLEIHYCSELKSFPKDGLPSKLKCICITESDN